MKPTHLNKRKRSRTRALGFTLVELMVVVSIVMVSAALAGPSIGRSLATARANRAVNDIIRLGRRARAESMSYGRAHVIRYAKDSASRGGRFELWRGFTNLCRRNDWATILSGACASTAECLDSVNSTAYDGGSNWVCMGCMGATCGTSCTGTVSDTQDLCFEPDGDIAIRGSGTTDAFVNTNTIQQFTVRRMLGTASVDVLRRALFPPGGTPRVLR